MPGLEEKQVPAHQATEELGESACPEVLRPGVFAIRDGRALQRLGTIRRGAPRRWGGRGPGILGRDAALQESAAAGPSARSGGFDPRSERGWIPAPLESQIRAKLVGEAVVVTSGVGLCEHRVRNHVLANDPVPDVG